jgi:hypothetical protein
MIFTPVVIDVERVIRGEEWAVERAVEWGGWAGCDNVHSDGRLDLVEGGRYLFWLWPRDRNGESTGDASLVEAWPVNSYDTVATRHHGDISLVQLERIIRAADATPTPQPPIPTPARGEPPPIARVEATGGDPVEGRLGSWCYGSACADVIPGPTALQPTLELAGPGAEIEHSLQTPYRFVHWRVVYAVDPDEYPGTILAEGGERYPDPDGPPPPPGATPIPELESAAFAGPPTGFWLLAVHLSFADELGDAVYYWHAVVP